MYKFNYGLNQIIKLVLKVNGADVVTEYPPDTLTTSLSWTWPPVVVIPAV